MAGAWWYCPLLTRCCIKILSISHDCVLIATTDLLKPPGRSIVVFGEYDTIDFLQLPTAFSTTPYFLEYFTNIHFVSNRHDALQKMPLTERAILRAIILVEYSPMMKRNYQLSGLISNAFSLHMLTCLVVQSSSAMKTYELRDEGVVHNRRGESPRLAF